MKQELIDLISAQQSGHENEPEFMIGEQLKEMAERQPSIEDILIGDLATSTMTLEAAAGELKKFADEHKGKNAKCFCITPLVAEGILRKFYGLPERPEREEASQAEPDGELIRLADYL